MALINLVNKITSAIDRKEITADVFLDLSKAFDTCGLALNWIKSHFLNRKQFVQFNQTCSSEQTIRCGVLLGSILGPLLFYT